LDTIVIVGGFLSSPRFYQKMQQELSALTARPAYLVQIPAPAWLLTVTRLGYVGLLIAIDRAVERALRSASGQRITLIGHSAGGVIARLYLSPAPLMGRSFNGLKKVNHLITLGSPHYSQGNLRRGGALSHYVESRYPGAYFQPEVRYTSCAGKFIRGNRAGSKFERWVYTQYEEICGQGDAWGDGLIPIQSALLKDSNQIVLEGISHYAIFGDPWFGSSTAIHQWWKG
jgi:pimeloyl-ACP methyl ester carboxylesterase